MADEITPELRQQRIKQFMSVLPLTLELAGLAEAAPGTLFNEGQMEARVISIRNAYKMALQLLEEVGERGK
ncbi:MAG: hypothetical protein MUF18_07065 [Fimbriiglobus sp.]|jgi:hypothetical protein|nr:hypothetical protein [Fimbriiglobus sp.]